MIEHRSTFNIPAWPEWRMQGDNDDHAAGFWTYVKDRVFYYKVDQEALYIRKIILSEEDYRLFQTVNHWKIITVKNFDIKSDIEIYIMETML